MRAGAEGISIIFTLPIRLVVFWYSFRVARQVSIEIYFHCSIKPSNTCMQNKSLRGKNFQLPYDRFLSCSNGTEHHRASPNVTNKKTKPTPIREFVPNMFRNLKVINLHPLTCPAKHFATQNLKQHETISLCVTMQNRIVSFNIELNQYLQPTKSEVAACTGSPQINSGEPC